MKYNKLIRDRIPEIIIKDNKNPVTHIAGDKEYWSKLKEKLEEEVKEFQGKEDEDELADILEVINAICDFKQINKESLEDLRKKKAFDRGAFNKKIILEEVKD